MKYRVRLRSRGTLRLGKVRTIRGPDHIVRFSDGLGVGRSNEEEHQGIRYTVEVDATDILRAIAISKNLASHAADMLSCAGTVAIEDPVPLFAIDCEPSRNDREFAQVIHDAPQLRQFRRAINEADFRILFDGLRRVREANPRAANRVDRALRYLRQSTLENDALDRFEDLWVGLEAINPLLREKYQTSTKFTQKCGNCGNVLACASCDAQVRAADNSSGIDYVVTEILGLSKPDAKLLRGKRIQIVHSTATFLQVSENLARATEIARQTLIAGIHDVLALPSDALPRLLRQPLAIVGNAFLVVVATLVDLPVAVIDAAERYPQLKLEGLELVLPTHPDADRDLPHPPTPDTAPLDVHAVQVVVSVKDFAGEVRSARVFGDFYADPEAENSEFQTIVRPLRPLPEP